jgi:hypothetical protein
MAMTNAALEAALKAALQRLVTALANKTAPDSLKLEGKTLAEITTQILAGKAASAAEADSALALGGKDLATIEAERAAALTAAIDALRLELEGSIDGVTKESIGLGDVVNYGVATETEALAGAADKYVTAFLADKIAQAKIDELVGASPETLNTIQEIAAALNNDPDVINSMMTAIGTKETPEGAQAKADAAQAAATAAAADALTTEATALRGEFAAADAALQGQVDANAAAIADLQAAVGEGSDFMQTGVTDLSLNPVNAGTPKSTYVASATNDGTATLRATMSTAGGGLVIEEDSDLDGVFVPTTVGAVEGMAIATALQTAGASPDVPYYITVTTSVKTLKEVVEDFETKTDATDARLTGEVSGLKSRVEGMQQQADAQGDTISNIIQNLAQKLDAAAKATGAEVIAGTDDVKYVTSLAAKTAIDHAVAELVGTAPEALNTINELAAALNNDPDVINTLMTQIGEKQSAADVLAAIEAALVPVNAAITAAQETADSKLDATAQAVDSALLGGQTAEQIIAAAQAGVDMSNVVEKGDNIDTNTVTIDGAQVTLDAAFGTVNGNLAAAVSTLEGQVAAEAGAREAADQALDIKIDNAVQVLEGTKVGRTDNIDANTVTQGEGETATQVALSTLIAQLQAGITAAGDAADLQALQDSFNAFVAAKATGADVIAGTDDVKYVTALAAKAAIDAAVADLVGTAPEALDTINELAAALNNDPDVINTLMTQIGEKQTAAQVQSAIDASLVPVNTAIDGKLGKTEQAADSLKLNGKTQAELTSAAADLEDATGVAGAGKFADAGQVAVKLAEQNTATATVASDLEALVIELTSAFDSAAAELEGTPAV